MDRLSSGKKSINVDDKYLSIAEQFLYGELAVALEIPREKIRKYVTERMGTLEA